MPKWYTLPYATFGHSKRIFSGLLLSQSDDSIKLSPPALQLQMTLNHNLFPSEMMTDLNHTDYKFIRIHLNLQPLQNDTVTNDKFDDMPHKNNISFATLSTLLWTLFSISVLALMLLGCWYCNTLRWSHARLRQICHRNKEAEADTPLCPI